MLKIRTFEGLLELTDTEATELRERLRSVPPARPAEETITVAANASTIVTFTPAEKEVVLYVLTQWMGDVGSRRMGDGPLRLRNAFAEELGAD